MARKSERASTMRSSPESGSAARPFAPLVAWAILALFLLVVYGPALRGGLLWDDPDFVPKPAMRGWDGLARIWFEHGAIKQYYPLTYSAFWVQHRLWGDATLGYHVVNVLLHAFNATLIWRILLRLRVPGALLAAALFAFHPVHVESVAWICELKNTLSGAFYLSAFLLALRPGDDADSPFLALGSRRWWSVLLLFAGALLSKAVTATFPAALLVVLWWREGELSWARHVRPLVPCFALALVAGAFSAWMEKTQVGAQGPVFDLDPVQRVLLAARALAFYAGKLAWPADLVFTYPRWTIDASSVLAWAYFVLVLAVVLVAWLARGRIGRGPLAALLFFAGTLFPALGFVDVFPFLYSFVADHFQYLASLGLLALVAGVAAERVRSIRGLASAGTIVVAALAFHSWGEARQYTDVETLYRSTIARNPSSWMAHSNLGVELAKAGRREEAVACYRAALELDAELYQTRFNLANALDALGRTDEAVAEYERALRTKPSAYEVHNNLAMALEKRGEFERALEHYRSAIDAEPRFATAHYNLGALASRRGELDTAIASLQRAVELAPDYAAAWNNLGIAYARQEKLAEAIPRFERAIALQPSYAEAHNNLGLALGKSGRLELAERHFRDALRFKPDYANARENLDRLLAARAKR